ncbi:MAG: gamma-glutamyl-gamma-aminobutyrate hydrolase family protein, partial [Bacteroidaceae bacterium]|nr:gamma-glutamyl-gamma-aminobutyrate hydrolase family protein [Bacteroidaceae bacterium]
MFNWKSTYDSLHATFPGSRRTPLIGITGNFGEKGCELAEGYFESVLRAGATPVVLPPTTDADALTSALDRIDGLLLSGGADLNPLYVGEEPIPALGGINPRRDLCELLLIRLAYDRQLPILGICRGIQMLVAALDGSIWQDLGYTSDHPGESGAPTSLLKHSQTLDRAVASHTVRTAEGSLLRQIMGGAETLFVNSFHHQAVREAGPHLRVSATAADGVVEAVESSEHKSILGVQWHPECFCLAGDESMMPLFRWLKDEAANYRAAREVHNRVLTLDSHCDTPMFFDQDIHFNQRDPKILVDLHKMKEGGLDASIMVAYIPQDPLTAEGRTAAGEYAHSQLLRVEQLAAENSAAVAIARSPKELYCLKAEGKRAIMLGIENGYAIGRDLSLLHRFKQDHGIVYMTLCHNGNNDVCGSAKPREGEQLQGVSDFGAEVIRQMNELGIMVDLSHASELSFYDALDLSQTPIVCSHSSSRTLCDHPRNLTDDQLRALATKGGVAQVTFYNGFLRSNGQATILDAVEHLNHMVKVMGIEHVGIGTDFDGDGGVPGLASASELINFTRRLLRERYSEDDLRLIWGGNFLRV